MPNVLARPQSLQNGDVVTEFRDTTLTSFVTYTYPEQQTNIVIENKGYADMIVNVGTYSNQNIQPGQKLKLSVNFTYFEIRSTITSQEFYAKATIQATVGSDPALRQDINTLSAQLSENATNMAETKFRDIEAPSAMMCIIDDDAMAAVWSKLKPISEEKGVPMVCAAPSSWVGTDGCLTVDQLQYLQNTLGWEVASHTKNHVRLAEIPVSDLDQELRGSKEQLESMGFKVQNLVYPFGSNNATVRNLAAKYYNSATLAGGSRNVMPVENFRLRRMGFAYLTDTPVVGFPQDTSSYEYYKARLDEAIANKYPLIIMTHVNYPENTETQLQYLRDLIDYAKAQGVPIVTLQKIYEQFGNVFEYKNANGDYVSIARNGKMYSPSLDSKMYEYSTKKYTNSNVITDFPYGKVTVSLSSNADAGGFPTGAGTLETHRQPDGADYNFQIWYPYNTNQIFKRRWSTSSSAWGTWDELVTKSYVDNTYGVLPLNSYTSASLNTAFPAGKVTVTYIDSSNNAGFPANAGILTTYRVSQSSNGWDRQEFRQHNSNKMWNRFALGSTGAWSAWNEIPTTFVDVLSTLNAYTSTSLITDFPYGKVTQTIIDNSNKTGFPNDSPGLLTTYRLYGNGWDRQEFRKYMSNELWSRYVDATGAWTTFTKISAV